MRNEKQTRENEGDDSSEGVRERERSHRQTERREADDHTQTHYCCERSLSLFFPPLEKFVLHRRNVPKDSVENIHKRLFPILLR